MPRLFIANLDAEESWAGQGRTLPLPVRRRMAAVGSLFRFVAAPGDAVWLPASLEPSRLPEIRGVPSPRWIHEPAKSTLGAHADARLVPWALARPWVSEVAAEAAAEVNGRAFGLRLGRELGAGDPSGRWVSSLEALLHYPEVSTRSSWVIKAPMSAAGRHRYIHRAGESGQLEAPPTVARLEGLFRRHGEMLFERWRDRVLDIGVLFEAGAADPRPRIHRQLVDRAGGVTAIEFGPSTEARLTPEDRKRLLEVARQTAAALGDAGYRGPAGLDAWSYRTTGDVRWTFLGEINARWTVGRLAREVATRLGGGAAGGLRAVSGADWRLELSAHGEPGRRSGAAGGQTWWLVRPDDVGRDGIRMERLGARPDKAMGGERSAADLEAV